MPRRVTSAGLSVRIIYRDLSALVRVGVPIMAEAGVGYSLMKSYGFPPVNFTPEEASALVTGGMLVAHFTDLSAHAPMHSALLKVRAVLRETFASQEGFRIADYIRQTPPTIIESPRERSFRRTVTAGGELPRA